MGLFGKSFEEKVKDAVDKLQGMGVQGLRAQVDGKTVTLSGEARDAAAKGAVMTQFNELVETENTINQIRVAQAAPAPAAVPSAATTAPMPSATVEAVTPTSGPAEAAPAAERWHDVVKGDTLSALAKKYYGSANKYMTIFEANRDQLDNPDVIKVGQRLRIP